MDFLLFHHVEWSLIVYLGVLGHVLLSLGVPNSHDVVGANEDNTRLRVQVCFHFSAHVVDHMFASQQNTIDIALLILEVSSHLLTFLINESIQD